MDVTLRELFDQRMTALEDKIAQRDQALHRRLDQIEQLTREQQGYRDQRLDGHDRRLDGQEKQLQDHRDAIVAARGQITLIKWVIGVTLPLAGLVLTIVLWLLSH